MLVMKPSQILRQRYTSCLSGMGLTSTKKWGHKGGYWVGYKLGRPDFLKNLPETFFGNLWSMYERP